MKPEAQRIAIAEACGWKELPIGGLWQFRDTDKYAQCNPENHHCFQLPEYTTDLNAMHEVEKAIAADKWADFLCELRAVVCESADEVINSDPETVWCMVHATAAQRAEAFCRALHPEKFK